MIKRVFIFNFCLVFCAIAYGQEMDYHFVDLLPKQADSILDVDFYVSKIIDNRVYKGNLGIAQKGMLNRKVLAKFHKPLEDELLNYINTILPIHEEKQALVLRINQLLISEHTTAFKETGKAIINLDVLKFYDETYYFLGSFSASAKKNSVDVTGKHDDRIREIIKTCIIEFSNSNYETLESRSISVEKLEEPVILKEKLKEGFFTSFMELYNNMPFQNEDIAFKNSKQRPNKLFLVDRMHKRALYYAYSDGNTIYLNASNYSGEKHFVKTKLIDKYLLFNDTFVNQNKAIGMSLAFGVLGVLASNQQTNVLLDLHTGQYYILDANKIRLLLKDDYPDLYKQIRKRPNDIHLVESILSELLKQENAKKTQQIIENLKY